MHSVNLNAVITLTDRVCEHVHTLVPTSSERVHDVGMSLSCTVCVHASLIEYS